MDRGTEPELLIAENIVQPLLMASNCSSIEMALEKLIEIAKTVEGRSDLASLNIISQVLRLCLAILYPVGHRILSLSLKLLRNLCAGELRNQNAFLEKNGAEIVSTIINSVGLASDNNGDIVRLALQLLGNFVLAGREHQRAVWCQFFPHGFLNIARVRSRETCDPLCMVIYTCCAGDDGLLTALCDEQQGLHVVIEIVRTASMGMHRLIYSLFLFSIDTTTTHLNSTKVGSGKVVCMHTLPLLESREAASKETPGSNTTADLAESWFKLLVSRICLEESYIASVFFKLDLGYAADTIPASGNFVSEQAYILSTLSEILNERIEDLAVTPDFALHILGTLRSAAAGVDFSTRGKTGLPTGSTLINVLGYSLTILRDICACDHHPRLIDDDVVNVLVSSGLIEMLLSFLSSLEPPEIIQKAMKQRESQQGATTGQIDCCPYKGYRRDIVAILGNCAYGRKRVQDEIRKKNGIVLLLQQCVTDEDNPFLREWGIWAARNLLEGNKENQEVVADLELQRSLDVPELARLGLRVEVDPITRRAKLVNR